MKKNALRKSSSGRMSAGERASERMECEQGIILGLDTLRKFLIEETWLVAGDQPESNQGDLESIKREGSFKVDRLRVVEIEKDGLPERIFLSEVIARAFPALQWRRGHPFQAQARPCSRHRQGDGPSGSEVCLSHKQGRNKPPVLAREAPSLGGEIFPLRTRPFQGPQPGAPRSSSHNREGQCGWHRRRQPRVGSR